MPERDQAGVELAHRLILPDRIPRVGTPAVRILAAFDAHLVAVVDARRSGQSHLDQRCQAEGIGIATRERDEPWRVMAVEQVQLHRRHLRRVSGYDARELPPELRTIDRADMTGVFIGLRPYGFSEVFLAPVTR